MESGAPAALGPHESLILLNAGYLAERICLKAAIGGDTEPTGPSRQNSIALVVEMTTRHTWQQNPTRSTLMLFEQFVVPHLTVERSGPAENLGLHGLFKHILQLLYIGCQRCSRELGLVDK